jgi:hypothetical protein
MKDLGVARKFWEWRLNMVMTKIHQEQYVKELLNRHGMEDL